MTTNGIVRQTTTHGAGGAGGLERDYLFESNNDFRFLL